LDNSTINVDIDIDDIIVKVERHITLFSVFKKFIIYQTI